MDKLLVPWDVKWLRAATGVIGALFLFFVVVSMSCLLYPSGGGVGIFVYRGQRRGIQQLAVTKIDYDRYQHQC